MTTRINLLPWREKRRKRQQQEFMAMLGFAAVIGVFVAFGWQYVKQGQIDEQRARNTFINKEVVKLERDIKEIERLEERRAELVERMQVIQDLQGNRPSIVYVFDQLVRTLPEGVYYTFVSRSGKKFRIEGVAESNNRISRLMRSLDESVWFEEPNLLEVSALSGEDDGERNQFTLTVQQGSPGKADENGDDGEGGEES